MVIYLGSDHRGFKLKNHLISFLNDKGYEVADMGNTEFDENDDYPDFASKVANKVLRDYDNAKGIVICGSGVGVNVVANKFDGIRSALVNSSDQAYDSRNDDDTNVLALASDYVNETDAEKIVMTWVETPFSAEERHRKRLLKIQEIERGN